jgi:Ca-activated chloride channel family protein
MGQSGKVETPGGAKANQRPAPTPAPEPSPQAADTSASVSPSNDASSVDDGDIIRVKTQLVSIPVRVMDKGGRFIGGLTQGNFTVLEDGKPQEIALFSNEQEPFTVALVLDMSYSTTFKIGEIQNAAIAFIDQLRPQDKVMVVSFDEEVHLLCDPTSDRKTIYAAIKSTKIATGTSLYEAVGSVMNKRLRTVQGRKAIILFTDGVDTTSRRSSNYDNIRDAMELDALIYPIHYDTFADVQKMKQQPAIIKQPPIQVPTSGDRSILSTILSSGGVGRPSDKGTTEEEYRKASEYLEEMGMRTGGTMYEATTLSNLADAYKKIASQLREFYTVSYYPDADRAAGKKTSIKVKVDQAGAVVKTREGYLVPRKTKVN